MNDYAAIRHAYYIEKKSKRQICREQKRSWKTVQKALASAEPAGYQVKEPREAPVLGPYKERIEKLLAENESLPHKQRYTAKRIYQVIREEGYTGSESGVRRYVGERRGERRKRAVYLKLEFDPGGDAQVDWGEGQVIMKGEPVTVQLFVMRLNYSRRTFIKAYPRQTQECFLDGHVAAFQAFGGVPQRISYDNLKVAVYAILTGRQRQEQERFILFRSHYLFASHYCTPGKGHEKGGVEHAVGYLRRNYMVPLPEVDDFEELNAYLAECCEREDVRTVAGQRQTIGEAWALERPHLSPLPAYDLLCCVTREVALNPHSQVVFETNRYSVPTDQAYPHLVLRAYPFHIEILHRETVLATHPRCYEPHQDVIDPLHYLPLLEQRPGAFEHAQPIRQWREQWGTLYERLLGALRRNLDEREAVREFLQVLALHREHPPEQVEVAIHQALAHGVPHSAGVRLCLAQKHLSHPLPESLPIDAWPTLAALEAPPPSLSSYDHLLPSGGTS